MEDDTQKPNEEAALPEIEERDLEVPEDGADGVSGGCVPCVVRGLATQKVPVVDPRVRSRY